MRPTLTAALVAMLAGNCLAQNRDYAAPDGAFAIRPPAGWTVARNPVGVAGFTTSFSAGAAETAAKIEIVTLALGDPSARLEDVAELLFAAVLQNIQNQGQIISQQVSKGKLGGQEAVRCNLTYRPKRGAEVEHGYMLATLGKKFALLAALSSLKTDEAAFREGETALATFAVESPTAGGADVHVAGRSLLDASTMATAVQQIRQNFKRESPDTVIIQGEPPLTRGSLVAFANLLGYVFDIQLTEAEFDVMQRHFVEYYQKQDVEGRKIIALGGQSILSGLQQGSEAEREKNKAEVKAVMANRFANGAKMGMEWAVAMHEAIQRRGQQLRTTQAEKPKTVGNAQVKTTFTEADLEAALEMLYFMWVGSGRDPSLVTPAAVVQVRTALVTNFERFSPQFQYVLCNAEKVYAQVRGAWQNSDAAGRAAMAAQFGRELDGLGLTVPRSGGGSSAWDDAKGMSESELRAQTAANYAYLSVNSSSFSGRTVTW